MENVFNMSSYALRFFAMCKDNQIKILDTIPEGWKVIEGATTAPNGYKWIYNCKSLFDKEYRQAIVKM